MVQKKNQIGFFLLLVLFLAQIGLAQHAAVHFTDHSHIVQSDTGDRDDGKHKNAREACQLCLSAKIFSQDLVDPVFSFSSPERLSGFVQIPADQFYTNSEYIPYSPRGPPTLSV